MGVLTDGPSEVDVLQESLETYRTKYKQEKSSKKEWKRVRLSFVLVSASTDIPVVLPGKSKTGVRSRGTERRTCQEIEVQGTER